MFFHVKCHLNLIYLLCTNTAILQTSFPVENSLAPVMYAYESSEICPCIKCQTSELEQHRTSYTHFTRWVFLGQLPLLSKSYLLPATSGQLFQCVTGINKIEKFPKKASRGLENAPVIVTVVLPDSMSVRPSSLRGYNYRYCSTAHHGEKEPYTALFQKSSWKWNTLNYILLIQVVLPSLKSTRRKN